MVTKRVVKLRKEFPVSKEAEELETVKCKLKWQNSFSEVKKDHILTIKHESTTDEIDLQIGIDYIVKVNIYYPFARSYSREVRNRSANLKLSHEVMLLGTNTLADLRDKILCTSDLGFCVDVESTFQSSRKPKVSTKV